MSDRKVLLLEDNDDDADFVIREIQRSGLEFHIHTTKSRIAYMQALEDVEPMLIISDYTIPGFDGLEALAMAREKFPETPFIFVSGTIGEERAIEALKLGASDYVLKDGLNRLIPSVRRALEEREMRRAKFQAERQLIEAEKRYERLVELSPDAILSLSDCIISFANDAAARLYGALGKDALVGRSILDFVHKEEFLSEDGREQRFMDAIAKPGLIEQRHRRFDGSEIYVELACSPIAGLGQRSVLMFARDITERKRYESTLQYQATHDSLTGLANRALLNDRLRQAISSADRHGWKVSIAYIDVDNFKDVNDSFGHDIGDRVLTILARRLQDIVRKGDTAARLGGDEFAVVFVDIAEVDQLGVMMERLLAEISRPVIVDAEEMSITCSAGLSVYPLDVADADAALRAADTAMFRAKERAHNSFQFYTPDMNSRSAQRLMLSASLRRAVERNEFLLHYQPQYDVRTRELNGIEALIRWNSPERGLVPPNDFIPIAEETGLIVPIGQWAIQEACSFAARLANSSTATPGMSVNISFRQFRQVDLPQFIEKLLRETGLPPNRLELELTESMVAQDAEFAIEVMTRLKSLGVRIAIDDFGTGYSNLSRLRRFPIDRLKIDKSFVSGNSEYPVDAAICRTIIALARSLDLMVIAEGVESEEQLKFLCEQGCDAVQGYLLGRPMPEQELLKLIGG